MLIVAVAAPALHIIAARTREPAATSTLGIREV